MVHQCLVLDKQPELPHHNHNNQDVGFGKNVVLATAHKNEILTALRSKVDWERKILYQPDSKTGWKPIYLSDTAIKILKQLYDLPEREMNDYIFKGPKYIKRLKDI